MFSFSREDIKSFLEDLDLVKLRDLDSLLQEEISAREERMVHWMEKPTPSEIQKARMGQIATAVDQYELRTGASLAVSSMVINYWKDNYNTFPEKEYNICQNCAGTGDTILYNTCHFCEGTGREMKEGE